MSYSVRVTITCKTGTVYALTIAQGDDTPGNVAPAYGLADPLTITQRLGSNSRLPYSHPEPDEATVSIIAPDNTTYPDIDLGDAIYVQVYPQASYAGTPVVFAGRVAGITGDPHDLGVLLTLSCIDYTADLAELPVGLAAYPVETFANRISRIFADAGIPAPGFIGYGSVTGYNAHVLAARSAGSVDDAYTLVRDTLQSVPNGALQDENGTAYAGTHAPTYYPMLVANITGGLLDPVTPFSIRVGKPLVQRIAYAPPYRLANVAGTYTVTVAAANTSPSTGSHVLDGGRVEFAPTFTKSKGDALPNVTLATDAQGNRYVWDWRAVTNGWSVGGGTFGPGGLQPYDFSSAATSGAPQLIQEIESVLDISDSGVASVNAAPLAGAYRVPFRPDNLAAWSIGTMSWQVWAEPSAWVRPELTELVTVARAQVGRLPNRREWVSGLVTGTVLKIEKGRPVIDLDVAPPTYDFVANREQLGASLGVVSMDSPIISGVTMAQVSTRDTLNDYALLRGT